MISNVHYADTFKTHIQTKTPQIIIRTLSDLIDIHACIHKVTHACKYVSIYVHMCMWVQTIVIKKVEDVEQSYKQLGREMTDSRTCSVFKSKLYGKK